MQILNLFTINILIEDFTQILSHLRNILSCILNSERSNKTFFYSRKTRF